MNWLLLQCYFPPASYDFVSLILDEFYIAIADYTKLTFNTHVLMFMEMNRDLIVTQYPFCLEIAIIKNTTRI